MAAVFPTAVKTFKARQNYTMIVDAGDVNQAYDEITALQTVLGPMPHQDSLDGSTKTWPSVKASVASARRGLTDPIVRVTATNVKVPYGKVLNPVFTSKQVDTHGAWKGGKTLISPRTGWYTISAYIRWHKDGANTAAQIPAFDHSGKLQIGITPTTDTNTYLCGQTHYFPSGWKDLTRHDCSALIYWPKGTAYEIDLYQKVQSKGTLWATCMMMAVYHRDPPTTNNM